ncbi:MAG: TolC family outer membrane protein [Noviherbaspirillum sp.]
MIPAPFKRSLGALVIALLVAAPAYGQSLKAAVERTLESNPDILIDASRRLSLDQALKGARAAYLPRADLALGGGREWSDNATTRALGLPGDRALNRTEASLTLTQMLFDGFAAKSEVERNQARVDSAASRLAGTSEQVALQAVEAYLEVLRHRDLVELTRENSGIHQRTFDQIKIRSDSGVGRRADLDQINARLGLARANLAAAEANLRDAEINFQRIVGTAPSSLAMPQAPAPAALPQSADEAIRMALESHPVLKSAEADVEAANAQVRAAKSTLYPRFDLQVGATRNRNIDGLEGSSNDQFAMVRMRYNLFNGGADTARINETVQLTSEAREIMERTRRQVAQSTRLSWNALTSVQERLPALRQHAESSAATRDAYTKQFSIGQRTLLDMLDAENETFTAASNYISGQYLETFARYRVLADLGRLLATLGVAPRPESLSASGR